MSRSARPWRRRAAITWVMRALSSLRAWAAAAAWAETPMTTTAMSGASRVSPWAVRVRVVGSAAMTVIGAARAQARTRAGARAMARMKNPPVRPAGAGGLEDFRRAWLNRR